MFRGGKGGETNDLFRGGSIHEITFDGFVFGNSPKFRNYPLVGVDLWDRKQIHRSKAVHSRFPKNPRSRADASMSAVDGSTALHLATQQGKLQVARQLGGTVEAHLFRGFWQLIGVP